MRHILLPPAVLFSASVIASVITSPTFANRTTYGPVQHSYEPCSSSIACKFFSKTRL